MIKKILITGIISYGILIGNSITKAGCGIQTSSFIYDQAICNDNVGYLYNENGYQIGGIADEKLDLIQGIFKYDTPRGNILNYRWSNGNLNYSYTDNGNVNKNGTINGFYYKYGEIGNDPLYSLEGRGYTYNTFDKLKNYLNDTYKYTEYYCATENGSNIPYCIICLNQGSNQGHICVDRNSEHTEKGDEFIDDTQAKARATKNPYTNNITTPITNTTCPTIKQLMDSMGKFYNTGLCYNNTNYYNGNTFVQIEKEDIFTIFNDDYQNYVNRISIYRNNCNAPATSQNCGNAFSGEFKKFSIISNAINSKVDEKNLWNYCNLGLNFDPNATTCTLNGTGIIKEEYTTEEEIQNIINNGTIPTPNTNSGNDNVINILNNCENGDRECYINDRNFIESLSNIYGKITGLFKERKNINGIIPEYILRITFITILFTVIFKK